MKVKVTIKATIEYDAAPIMHVTFNGSTYFVNKASVLRQERASFIGKMVDIFSQSPNKHEIDVQIEEVQ